MHFFPSFLPTLCSHSGYYSFYYVFCWQKEQREKKKIEMAIKHIRQAKKGSHIGTMDEETYNFGISFVSDIDDTLREIRTRHYDN